MRALILAAGLGTRLRPLTDSMPKALVPVGGRPMLDYSLELFAAQGFSEVLINVHYLGDQIIDYADSAAKRFGLNIKIQDERKEILGSGGAVALAREWLYADEDTALIWNPDGLLQPNFKELSAAHSQYKQMGAQITLTVMEHEEVGTRYQPVCVKENRVLGFRQKVSAPDVRLLHFAGAYLLEKSAAALLPPAGTVADVTEYIWFPMVKSGKMFAWEYRGPYQDLGTPEDVESGNQRLAQGEFRS